MQKIHLMTLPKGNHYKFPEKMNSNLGTALPCNNFLACCSKSTYERTICWYRLSSLISSLLFNDNDGVDRNKCMRMALIHVSFSTFFNLGHLFD